MTTKNQLASIVQNQINKESRKNTSFKYTRANKQTKHRCTQEKGQEKDKDSK